MDADEATSRKTNEVKFMGHTFSSEKDWRKEKKILQSISRLKIIYHSHWCHFTNNTQSSTNSFDRMVEKMDDKVNDEDIQEVLCEAPLILDLNRQQWTNYYMVSWRSKVISYCESPPNLWKDILCFNTSCKMKLGE